MHLPRAFNVELVASRRHIAQPRAAQTFTSRFMSKCGARVPPKRGSHFVLLPRPPDRRTASYAPRVDTTQSQTSLLPDFNRPLYL